MSAESDSTRDGVATQRDAGFANSLELGARPALVLVDFVRAYFEPGAKLFMGDDSSVRHAAQILAVARDIGLPVVHTRVQFSAGGLDGGYFFKKVGALTEFVGDSDLGQIMPAVAPLPNEPVIVKQYASAFFGTTLASTLRAANVDTIVVMGVSTSGCIRATVVDAIQSGFIPVVPREAVGDRDARPHEASLFDIQAKYGEVRSQQEVLTYLSSDLEGRKS